MNVFDCLDGPGAKQAAKLWKQTKDWSIEERPVQTVRKIVIDAATRLIFCRGEKPRMLVAAHDPKILHRTHTVIEGDKLRIERTPNQISSSLSRQQVFYGPIHGGIAGRDIIIVGGKTKSTYSALIEDDLAILAIVLPSIEAFKIKGGAVIDLLDLNQDELRLKVIGAGTINAVGKVKNLTIDISGAGTIKARELIAQFTDISVSGAANSDTVAMESAVVRISGAGNAIIRGNPKHRDTKVSGVGNVRFE